MTERPDESGAGFRPGRGRRFDLRRSGPWIGLTALAPLLFCYVMGARLVPWWATVGLVVVWLLLAVLTLGLARPRPRAAVLPPLIGFVVWGAVLALVAVT